jgi:hypothetical protein
MSRIILAIWHSLGYMGSVLVPHRFRPDHWASGARGMIERRADQALESPWTWFWRVLRWTLHFLIVALLLVGLGYLNYVWDLERLLGGPWPLFRKIWLPLLGLLVYILCWLGAWLWYLLGPERDTGEFPDIQAAWQEAVRTLSLSGIDIREAPLFVVLGQPHGGPELLFSPAKLHFPVRGVPFGKDEPLHVYANREGIFVSCSPESLGRKLEETTVRPAAAGEEPPKDARVLGDQLALAAPKEELAAIGQVAQPRAAVSEASSLLAEVGEGGELVEEAIEEVSDLALEPRQVSVEEAEAPGAVLTKRVSIRAEEQERMERRFRYLCRLIARSRRPYCSANGILAVVPQAVTENDWRANVAATELARLVLILRETLQVHCPVFTLFCDLHEFPGCRELLLRLPEAQRQRLLGQPFPLAPDLDGEGALKMLTQGVGWIADALLPSLAYHLMLAQPNGRPANGDGRANPVEANRQLYGLVQTFWERGPRLERIVARLATTQREGPPLVGGCYLAATGPDPVHEQGFVGGVFGHLIESQDAVAWTGAARAEDAAYRRWTRIGYVTILLVVGSLAGLAYWLYR